MRGPAPKPTKLKIAAGNPGKRPINGEEPQPEEASGRAPDWLSDDAKKIWFQIAGPMTRSGLATAVDQYSLGRYCGLLAQWIRAYQESEKAGTSQYTVKNKQGKITGTKEFPASAFVRRVGPQLTALEREFGMTPASRTRIRLERDNRVKDNPNEAIESFLARRPNTMTGGAGA